MQRKFSAMFAAAVLAGTLTLGVRPLAAQEKAEAITMPKVGDMAPDFKMRYFDGNDAKEVTLSQYRGKKNVVLAFFIFAFTGG